MSATNRCGKTVVIKIKKLHPDACIPAKMSVGASGFDLVAIEETVCSRPIVRGVRTGIAIELPYGYEAQIRSRSSMLSKRRLIVSNSPGTIDSDYRGEIIVLLHHLKPDTIWVVKKGERIAQLIVKKIPEVVFEEVDDLCATKRGNNGLGSTGV